MGFVVLPHIRIFLICFFLLCIFQYSKCLPWLYFPCNSKPPLSHIHILSLSHSLICIWRLSFPRNLFLSCYCQAPALLFSSISSMYHSVVSVRIQRQDKYHRFFIWLCPAFFSSSSGHRHACLSSCHHILTVVKQEKKNSSLLHRCLWSFLLLTNSFLGLLDVSLAINCLWTVIKDRNPPLHKAPGGLSASPLQGRTAEGQASFHLTLMRTKQTTLTLPSPSANLLREQETHAPRFSFLPGLGSIQKALWPRRKQNSKLKQGQTMNMNLAIVVYP